MILKRIALCLLIAVMCVTAFGCSRKRNPLPDLPMSTPDNAIIPEITGSSINPVAYTPVYASAFGDTVILATVPVEEWQSEKSDCPVREISNGGRIKCNGKHEDEVPITKVLILDDIIPRNCSGWFRDMTQLEKIDGLNKLHTHQVSDMSYMFAGCGKLTSLDLSSWHVSNVINTTEMFKGCNALANLPDWYE